MAAQAASECGHRLDRIKPGGWTAPRLGHRAQFAQAGRLSLQQGNEVVHERVAGETQQRRRVQADDIAGRPSFGPEGRR
jgi:hypothetical protein